MGLLIMNIRLLSETIFLCQFLKNLLCYMVTLQEYNYCQEMPVTADQTHHLDNLDQPFLELQPDDQVQFEFPGK